MDGLNARGSRLWASLLAQDASLGQDDCPHREVALSACRTADRLERLEVEAASADSTIDGRSGPVTNPVFVEVRQQAALLARLIAALRLPDDATGKKPQRRQVRGVQRPSKVGSAKDRLRSVG